MNTYKVPYGTKFNGIKFYIGSSFSIGFHPPLKLYYLAIFNFSTFKNIQFFVLSVFFIGLSDLPNLIQSLCYVCTTSSMLLPIEKFSELPFK